MRQQKFNVEILLKIICIPVLIAVWYVLYLILGKYRIPSPFNVFTEFFTTFLSSEKLEMAGAGSNGFWPHILATMLKVTVGYVIGSLFGLFFGILMKISKKLYFFVNIPLDVLKTVPPIAFVPLMFMFFGRTLTAQLVMIALYSFITIVINTMNAIENVPPIYQKLALTLGANKIRIFRNVIFPCIIPELLGAFRVGIIWAWGYQVIIEMMGAPDGIGKVFFLTRILNALDIIIIGVLWVVLLAGITDFFLRQIFKKVTNWQEKVRKELVEY